MYYMEVILDTNFIISCVKKKIDFISQLEGLGFKVIMPREVFQELRDLRMKVSHNEKSAIDIALKIFDSAKIKKIKLGNKSVDSGLIDKGKQGAYIATLDAGIKRSVPNRVLISMASNSIIIERN